MLKLIPMVIALIMSIKIYKLSSSPINMIYCSLLFLSCYFAERIFNEILNHSKG